MASTRQRLQRLKRNRLAVVAVIAACVLTFACAGVAAYAKYAHQVTDDRPCAANSFCFSSDFLSEAGQTYTLSAGTTQLSIELRNYDDSLRWSDDDVEYSYAVTQQVDGGSETPFTAGTGTINRSKDAGSSSTVSVTGLAPGTYVVTATSTSPYSKTLTGTFVIPSEIDGVLFKVEDSAGSPYAKLTVSTRSYAGNIMVSWPDGIFPDTTQPAFRDTDTYAKDDGAYKAASCDIGSLGKFGSATYRFFKTDPQQDYSAGGTGGITATANSN